MAEYIERETALEIAMQYCPDDDGSCSKAGVDMREMLDEIEAIPAADVAPVRHGRWVRINYEPIGHDYVCSVCGWKNDMISHYCPNCGARMDKDGDGE